MLFFCLNNQIDMFDLDTSRASSKLSPDDLTILRMGTSGTLAGLNGLRGEGGRLQLVAFIQAVERQQGTAGSNQLVGLNFCIKIGSTS